MANSNDPNKKIERRWIIVSHQREKALQIFGGIVAGSYALRAASYLYDDLHEGSILVPCFRFATALATTGLYFLWVFATGKEIGMLKNYLWRFLPSPPKGENVAVYGLMIVIVGMALTVKWPVAYGGCLVVFKILEVWGIRLRDTRLKQMLLDARQTPRTDEIDLGALNAIERYYTKRPQMELAVTVGYLGFAGVLLGVLALLWPSHAMRPILTVAAYTTVIVALLVGELVYLSWRRTRDRDLTVEAESE
jgi:hypothetical protein